MAYQDDLKEQIKNDVRNRVASARARRSIGWHGCGGGLGWGAVLVLVGTVILLDHMGYVNADKLWRFWPMIAVVAGLFNMLEYGHRVWGVFLIFLGAILQLNQLGIAHFGWADVWPLALIGVGFFLIWGSLEARRAAAKWNIGGQGGDPRSTLNEHVLFGGIERRINSKEFRGGQLHAVFGGIEIDLRDAEMAEDQAVLVANSIFGGIEVRVPETWFVAAHGQGIFGGFTDSTRYRGVNDATNPQKKTLIVRGASVFGGVEIRN
jgi:predicted membrane protein